MKSAKLFLRSFTFLGSSKKRFLLGWLLSCAEFAIAFITPFMYRQLVLIVTENNNSQGVQIVIALFIAVLLLTPIVCIGSYLRFTAAAVGAGNMQKQLVSHIQRMSVQKTIDSKKGDYVNRLSNDAQSAARIFQGYSLVNLFQFLVYFSVSFIILASINIVLLGISVFFSVMSFIAAVKLNPKARALEGEARNYTSHSASHLVEAFRCMPVIRVFLLKGQIAERYYQACRVIMQKRISFRTLLGVVWAVSDVLRFAVEPIGFIVGIHFMMRGDMGVAQVVFAASVMGIMAEGMRQFGFFTQFIQSGLVAATRVFELFDTPIEDERITVKPVDINEENAIILKDLSFSYATANEVAKNIDMQANNINMPVNNINIIINNISMTIKKGELLAIVGSSGGGKTTLLKLLQALYDKTSGDIVLFGSSVDELSRGDIRSLSSYVQQDCFLFDGTIAENISLGNKKYNQAEIEEAAKKANIHDFIVSLPDGYETMVGERGSFVSGGQGQRITIARAILKDAPILLLDEATAALDSHAEIEVHAALQELMKNKTTIVVAHRLSTVQDADRIIVLENGVIVEEGKHDALMQMDGAYMKLIRNAGMSGLSLG